MLAAMAEEAGVTSDDTVVEVGVGAGALTKALAARARRVIGFEVDERLRPILDEALRPFPNAEVLFEDILGVDKSRLAALGRFKVAANLPYYITAPVLFYFLESDLDIESMSVMVQKEVALRMTAAPGTSDYGALSLTVRARADARLMRVVDRKMFTPSPNVDSATVRLDFKREYDPFLVKVIRRSFAMRRKTLLNNVIGGFGLAREEAEQLILSAGINPSARAETLDLADMTNLKARLAEKLAKK